MNKLISSMRLRDNSWFKKRSSLIWIRIISKFKFIVSLQSWPGLNFLSSVNWAARRWYSFGHANLCLHPLVISMIIRKVFSDHENNGCTCTHRCIHNHRRSSMYVCLNTFAKFLRIFLCYFQSLILNWNDETDNYLSLFYKDGEKSFSSNRNTK